MTRSTALRLVVALAFGLGGAALFELWSPHGVELFVELEPVPGATLPARFDVRITRAEGGAEVARQRRERLPDARSLVVPARLSRGRFRLEAWDASDTSRGRWEGEFEVGGADDVAVRLIRVP